MFPLTTKGLDVRQTHQTELSRQQEGVLDCETRAPVAHNRADRHKGTHGSTHPQPVSKGGNKAHHTDQIVRGSVKKER